MILVDTNVFVDVALNREPFVEDSRRFLNELSQSRRRAFVSTHSLVDLQRIIKSEYPQGRSVQYVLDVIETVDVVEMNRSSIRYAASLNMPDFEDAVQAAAAMVCGARQIVTRNLKDFKRSPVPALTPGEILAEWGV